MRQYISFKQYKSLDKIQQSNFNNNPLTQLKLPPSVHVLLRQNSDICTIADLLEMSRLDLFHALGNDYVLFRETSDALELYGLKLPASTDPQYKAKKALQEESQK